MTRDFYQILGVPSTADFTAIKRAYYRRAKECHTVFKILRSRPANFRFWLKHSTHFPMGSNAVITTFPGWMRRNSCVPGSSANSSR